MSVAWNELCDTYRYYLFISGIFAARRYHSDHSDGFGIAFFEDKACRLFVDNQSAVESPIAELIRNYPIKSRNVIAHIRKATQGKINLENSHPFSRELWGRRWILPVVIL